MSPEVARSYAECARVARTQALNFYHSFVVLPPDMKAQMCAIYAFMRHSDDVSDDMAAGDRRARLTAWREALACAYEGDVHASPILPAFHDTVTRRSIPRRFFDELIDGMEMDLDRARYETFDDLYPYCYRAASVVGIVCLHVWGFRGGAEALERAEACGIAFQLTNIIRDIREDAERGRVYLPAEDLRRFGYTEEELQQGAVTDAFRALVRFEIERARAYYASGAELMPLIEPAGRPSFHIMFTIYRGLLEAIDRRPGDLFARRVRLSAAHKASVVARAWLASRIPGCARLLRV
ncbi:MAG TPA: phytoene/squalene synthase family protein [Chthonomonadales bacterium]|nr:phytoene/squalene synthase family protein [Chthonomonadales bacterium]